MDRQELPGYQDSLRNEHLIIAQAIKSGDADAAGAGMRTHLRRGLQVNSGAAKS
jgi:DNA-binding GntR family transcriptional regulator